MGDNKRSQVLVRIQLPLSITAVVLDGRGALSYGDTTDLISGTATYPREVRYCEAPALYAGNKQAHNLPRGPS